MIRNTSTLIVMLVVGAALGGCAHQDFSSTQTPLECTWIDGSDLISMRLVGLAYSSKHEYRSGAYSSMKSMQLRVSIEHKRACPGVGFTNGIEIHSLVSEDGQELMDSEVEQRKGWDVMDEVGWPLDYVGRSSLYREIRGLRRYPGTIQRIEGVIPCIAPKSLEMVEIPIDSGTLRGHGMLSDGSQLEVSVAKGSKRTGGEHLLVELVRPDSPVSVQKRSFLPRVYDMWISGAGVATVQNGGIDGEWTSSGFVITRMYLKLFNDDGELMYDKVKLGLVTRVEQFDIPFAFGPIDYSGAFLSDARSAGRMNGG